MTRAHGEADVLEVEPKLPTPSKELLATSAVACLSLRAFRSAPVSPPERTGELDMKAVVLTAYGDIDKLELRELPDPHAAPGSIVVRMAGASINPIDWKIRKGEARERMPLALPAVLGRDASGEVIEVGPGVTSFVVGDRVLGLVMGAYAERVAAPVEAWTKIPAGLDYVEAGALPLVLLTGAQLMERAVDPKRGDVVMVTGAVGSVGRAAVFAARQREARVWAGVRALQKGEAEKLGADGVVALDDDAEVARLPMFDAIADTVGGETIQKLYPKLKPGGVIGSVLGEPKGARDRGFVVHAFMAQPDAAMLARYAAAVAEKALEIPIVRKMPLDEARAAQELAEKKRPGGKVLLVGR
jgi:NADPH:quinone reductase-like Zn-dependent oxidoreductase